MSATLSCKSLKSSFSLFFPYPVLPLLVVGAEDGVSRVKMDLALQPSFSFFFLGHPV